MELLRTQLKVGASSKAACSLSGACLCLAAFGWCHGAVLAMVYSYFLC